MSRLIRSVCVVAASAAVFCVANVALADSRLFTVRTDQPGVAITDAYRNGKQLTLGGRNGGDTIFRIDNPSGQVPCTNRIQFVASNGRSLDSTVNLCATNWDLTLSLSGSNGGNAGGGSVPPSGGGAAFPSTGQAVVIATDDPNVTITGVFMVGQPVPIAARQDPYVQINVLGSPQGFQCQRDLGLSLSDGRRIARLVDICQSNFLVVVPLVGGPQPPAPPPSMRPPVGHPLPQPLPQPVPQPLPVPPASPEYVDNMTWLFLAKASGASLVYGIPNTDESEFSAFCKPHSGSVVITLSRTADELGPGGKVAVRLSGGLYSRNYSANGSAISQLDGLSHPVLQVSTGDALWASMIKESALQIGIGSGNPYALSLSGSAAKVKPFLAVCSVPIVQPTPVPQPLPPPGPQPFPGPEPFPGPQPFPGDAISYACDDGSFLQVSMDQTSAAVSEFGSPPIILFRAPAPSGRRWVAGAAELRIQSSQIVWSSGQGDTRYCLPQ